MAIACECFCGARYSLPDSYAGKRAKCARCGHLIVVPAGEGGQSEPIALCDRRDPPSADAEMTAAEHERQTRLQSMPPAPQGMSAPPPVVIETGSGFWRDAGKSFNLFCSLESAFAFLFIWLVNLAVFCISLVPLLGLVAILIYGYVCSYYMRSVTHAACGEEGLPTIGVGGSWIDDMLIPMLQWWGCQLVVLGPAIMAAIVLNIYAVPSEVSIVVCGVLGAMGMFFWPIFILTVALAGFSMLIRFDKCISAVFRSPGPYVIICILVVVAIAPIWGARIYFHIYGAEPVAEFLGVGAFSLRILLLGLEAYCMLVCARLVGLYYHHFKEDFPWALG